MATENHIGACPFHHSRFHSGSSFMSLDNHTSLTFPSGKFMGNRDALPHCKQGPHKVVPDSLSIPTRTVQCCVGWEPPVARPGLGLQLQKTLRGGSQFTGRGLIAPSHGIGIDVKNENVEREERGFQGHVILQLERESCFASRPALSLPAEWVKTLATSWRLAFRLTNYLLCTDRSRTVWNVSPIRDWSLCHLFPA